MEEAETHTNKILPQTEGPGGQWLISQVISASANRQSAAQDDQKCRRRKWIIVSETQFPWHHFSTGNRGDKAKTEYSWELSFLPWGFHYLTGMGVWISFRAIFTTIPAATEERYKNPVQQDSEIPAHITTARATELVTMGTALSAHARASDDKSQSNAGLNGTVPQRRRVIVPQKGSHSFQQFYRRALTVDTLKYPPAHCFLFELV